MTYQTLIDAACLAPLVEQQKVLVFDCRFDLSDVDAGRVGYLSGHIPGALYLDLDRDLSGTPDGGNGRHPLPERAEFAARMAELGLSRGVQVVSYDTSGGFYASRLWWMLRWLGHRDVAVLDGGLAAWTGAGLALASGDEPVGRGDFEMSPEPAVAAVDVAAVEANLESGNFLIVDARTAERFAGAPHPLDDASGHIPGAANRPFQRNLTAEGTFKPAAELARDFRAVLGGISPEQVVHQCGSGVTATHNLLAMEVAGLTGSRLYPGSWSEWTSDTTRSIASGSD
ncbi:sulfurtransferase [Sphingomonas crusticola]|uniref:sulfurtransferase n=1 Tax=Sphingomonas crusticola TaxID=1697973 RepID=UPI000E2659FA|nr:sulfurtransferase [Sphingomonas crusticola]